MPSERGIYYHVFLTNDVPSDILNCVFFSQLIVIVVQTPLLWNVCMGGGRVERDKQTQ